MSFCQILTGASTADIPTILDVGAFVKDLKNDLAIAKQLASQSNLNFKNPLKAVYHYRKHGEEFPKFLKQYSSMEAYFGPVKNYVIDRQNLSEVTTLAVSSEK